MKPEGNGDLRDYQGISAHGGGVVQVDVGISKSVAVWLIVFACLTAFAIAALVFILFELDDQSARIAVLEYERANICAALIQQEIIEACH